MRVIVVSFLVLMVACNQREQGKQASTLQSDTLSEPTINLGELRAEFIRSYRTPIVIDTSFTWKDTLYTLRLEHLCSMDSALTIPAKYNFDTNDPFVTHHFKSQLLLLKQEDTIMYREITKKTFEEKLTPELEAYATLLFPTMHINKDTIEIAYSLVIPVTDVGIPVSILIDRHGSFLVN